MVTYVRVRFRCSIATGGPHKYNIQMCVCHHFHLFSPHSVQAHFKVKTNQILNTTLATCIPRTTIRAVHTRLFAHEYTLASSHRLPEWIICSLSYTQWGVFSTDRCHCLQSVHMVSELLGITAPAAPHFSFCVRAPIDGYYRVLGPAAQSRHSDGSQANNSFLPEGCLCFSLCLLPSTDLLFTTVLLHKLSHSHIECKMASKPERKMSDATLSLENRLKNRTSFSPVLIPTGV